MYCQDEKSIAGDYLFFTEYRLFRLFMLGVIIGVPYEQF